MEVACQSLGWCAQLHQCDSGLVPLRKMGEIHLTRAQSVLKRSTCILLPQSILSCLPWAEVCRQPLLLPGCELEAVSALFLFPTRQGMCTVCMRGPFPWLLQWRRKKWFSAGVIITNSYFSDYRRTVQIVSRYIPLFLVLPHEAVLPLLSQPPSCFSPSGTVMWTAALQLNTWTPAFGIRSK